MSDAITILHVSDMQFGKNHQFGRFTAAADGNMDTLLQRISNDLEELKNDKGLKPDIIAITGDLAEWALPAEFVQAKALIEGLEQRLGLPRERTLIIPGNHDVNRKLCRSYFDECEGNSVPPVWPAVKKWEAFLKVFGDRFDASRPFGDIHPYSFAVLDDLRIVVACMNSTMAEGHFDKEIEDGKTEEETLKLRVGRYGHFGHCGEKQLQWFADKLKPYREKGWLRLGLIHHNLHPESRKDDSALADVNDLARIVGDELSVILHGHTHRGAYRKLAGNTMTTEVPVISTGSAGLRIVDRPDETSMQYEIVRIESKSIVRYGRRFDLGDKRFVGDTALSPKGNEWIDRRDALLHSTEATFPKPPSVRRRSTPVKDKVVREPREDERLGKDMNRPDFLDRVRTVCSLKFHQTHAPTVMIKPASVLDGAYLEVGMRNGVCIETFPVAAVREATPEALASFRESIDRFYRLSSPFMRSHLVAETGHPPASLVAEAARAGIILSNFVEFQGLIDFEEFVERQTAAVLADERYVPKLYVQQRLAERRGAEWVEHADAIQAVQNWLVSDDSVFLLLLADFGTGKSFLVRELARRMPQEMPHVVPFLLELRDLDKTHDIRELVSLQLTRRKIDRIDLAKFQYMLREGRIALLADGFDELVVRVTYDTAAEYLDALYNAAEGRAKILVTSRTNHFFSADGTAKALAKNLLGRARFRRADLRPFNPKEVGQFIEKRKPEESEEWKGLIERVRDLKELAPTPRMLSFIIDLPKEDLIAAVKKAGHITAAKLYELLIDKWLKHEAEKTGKETGPALTPQAVRLAVTQLAIVLWGKTEPTCTLGDLATTVSDVMRKLNVVGTTADEGVYQLGVGSLLVRHGEDRFAFLHQSVLEWLVAADAAIAIANGSRPALLQERRMSELMADFLWGLASKESASAWAADTLRSNPGGEAVANAELLIQRLHEVDYKVEIKRLNMSGQNLRGQDLRSLPLEGSIRDGAEATEAVGMGINATGSSWRNATLIRGNFRGANFLASDFSDALLSEANLMGADLRNAHLSGARFRRAKLVGAKIDLGALDALDTFGAALPSDRFAEPFFGFASIVHSITFHPESDLIATGHQNGTIQIWEASSGKALRALEGHEGSVRSVAFASDGRTLASGSDDKTVRLWEASSGKVLRTLEGHAGIVWSVAFASDGRTLASGSDDKTVRLWDASSGKALRMLKGHAGIVWSVAFASDGRMLASGSSDQTARLWEASSGKALRTLEGHTDYVMSVAFASDGRTLASGSSDQTVRLWEASSGKALRTLEGHTDYVMSVAFASDGRTLASGSSDQTVRLWEASSGKALPTLAGHVGYVRSVAFASDGRTLASGSSDKTVRLWEASSGKVLRVLEGHAGSVWSVAFASEGRTLASGSDDKTVRLWDVSSGKVLSALEGHTGSVWSVAFASDGRTLASGSDDKTVRLWDASSGKGLRTLEGHAGIVWSLAFAFDGRTLASGSSDQTVRLWEVSSGKALRVLEGHVGIVWSVAFASDGRMLASGSSDKTVRLWDASSGKGLRTLEGHAGIVWSLAFAFDGRTLASGSSDQTVRLWDASSGKVLRTLEGHAGYVRSVAFASDGRTLASGSGDKTVRLWEASSGKALRTLAGHAGSVMSVAFASDGRTLASGSDDGTVRLWDVASGRCLVVLLSTANGWAAFSPDGRYKYGGELGGSFWHAINLCRFDAGELDDVLPLRMKDDEPFIHP